MYTADMIYLLWDDPTVRWWITMPASIVTLTVLCVLNRHLILQMSDSPKQENLHHINHTNTFAMDLIVTIND